MIRRNEFKLLEVARMYKYIYVFIQNELHFDSNLRLQHFHEIFQFLVYYLKYSKGRFTANIQPTAMLTFVMYRK